MNQHPLKKKLSLVVLGMMMATVSADNLRDAKWGDPFCSVWNQDGSCCLKCSDHYYADCNGVCQPVSDFCKEWDDKTGACTSCFPSYGNPVDGVCSNTPVDQVETISNVDDNCAEYGFVDNKNNWTDSSDEGCKKVCKKCNDNYYLTK